MANAAMPDIGPRDLTAALALHDQKLERRVLALVAENAWGTAYAPAAAHAQAELALAQADVALAIVEELMAVVETALRLRTGVQATQPAAVPETAPEVSEGASA